MLASLIWLIMSISALSHARITAAGAVQTGFLDRRVEIDGVSRPYVVYVPADYDAAKQWPVILFLHGKGECGTDGFKPVGQGIGRAIMGDRSRWPFIVVFPQKPDAQKEWEDFDSYVMAALAAASAEFHADADRMYLTGLSQGGHGTWTLGSAHNEKWAAIVPICGYGDPQACVQGLKSLPTWCFHGGADNVVSPEQSRRMSGALKAAGGQVRYTEYEGVNHNSWDRAYSEEELPAWLLSHRRGK